MVFNRINVLKILLIFISVIVFFLLMIKNTNQIETNLAKSILPKNIIENTKIIPIIEKPSKTIKIVFEADDEDNVNLLKQNFIDNLDSTVFIKDDIDFSKIIDTYSKHPTNFLSKSTRESLEKNDFETIYQQGLERLYNPVGIQLVEFNEDPFLLFTDFLLSNDINAKKHYINGNCYDSAFIKIRPDIKNINKEISKIIKLKKQYSNKNQQIYLAGTPIHTYYTSLSSSITINLVCAIITALIIFLTYLFFRNYLLLIPIALSISYGYLAGFSVTNTIYNNFHLITLLFGTTLIGIGIDYSYHYIFSRNKDFGLYKDLTLSFLSTATAFSLLYLLKIDILSQIATFTNIGLLAIFTFILIIYPCIKFSEPRKYFSPNFRFKHKKFLISLLVIIIVVGFSKLTFDDSLVSLYKPSKVLLKSETLFNNVENQFKTNGTIITVFSNSEADLIKNEEKVTSLLDELEIKYISISKFIPSADTQKENFELVKKLYKNKLEKYNSLLSKKQIEDLINSPFIAQDFNGINYLFNDLILDKKTSLIIPYSETEIPELKIKNVEVINFQDTISEYLKKYRIDLLKVLPLIYFSLYLLLMIFYGIKNSTRMILPIALSSLLVISFISIIGVKLNLFNILGLLLALGFTIDYAIFNKSKTKEAETAIFLACITTAISFLLLIFTTFKLISTLALTLSLGIIFNYILIKVFTNKKEV